MASFLKVEQAHKKARTEKTSDEWTFSTASCARQTHKMNGEARRFWPG